MLVCNDTAAIHVKYTLFESGHLDTLRILNEVILKKWGYLKKNTGKLFVLLSFALFEHQLCNQGMGL